MHKQQKILIWTHQKHNFRIVFYKLFYVTQTWRTALSVPCSCLPRILLISKLRFWSIPTVSSHFLFLLIVFPKISVLLLIQKSVCYLTGITFRESNLCTLLRIFFRKLLTLRGIHFWEWPTFEIGESINYFRKCGAYKYFAKTCFSVKNYAKNSWNLQKGMVAKMDAFTVLQLWMATYPFTHIALLCTSPLLLSVVLRWQKRQQMREKWVLFIAWIVNDFSRYLSLPFPRELKFESRVFTLFVDCRLQTFVDY